MKLDKKLNFNEHVDDLCKKVSQRIGVLKKIKGNLPLEERLQYTVEPVLSDPHIKRSPIIKRSPGKVPKIS